MQNTKKMSKNQRRKFNKKNREKSNISKYVYERPIFNFNSVYVLLNGNKKRGYIEKIECDGIDSTPYVYVVVPLM